MGVRGLVADNQKKQPVLGVDRNNLINSILIQVFTCTNMPVWSCAKNRATRGAIEPIAFALLCLAAVKRNLVNAGNVVLGSENRFDAAHKAIMKCAMIGLWAKVIFLYLVPQSARSRRSLM